MKNYLAYKEEIRGFGEVSEAVKTVEKIAAASIARFRQEMMNLDAYQQAIRTTLARLSVFHQTERAKKPGGRQVLVVLTSDKGLTGGLWRRMIDEFLKTARGRYDLIIPIGSKGEKYLAEEKIAVDALQSADGPPIKDISQNLSKQFRSGSYAYIDILYPTFVSLLEYRPAIVPFLPAAFTLDAAPLGFPIVEPAGALPQMFNSLIEKYIASYFQKMVAETKLSEHSARTVSMERASVKTDELIKGLTLTYRKERRRLLTQKQLESFIAHKSL
jgi:F-type H+-transporting ATPase subunit gamma